MAKADVLNKAIVEGDRKLVKSLISDGADIDHLLGMKGTALCAAIAAKQTPIASLLIESGCGVNVEDFDREPPLYLAVRKGCMDVAKMLIEHPSCKIDKADPLTNTPTLCYAAKKGITDVIRWMMEAGCNTKVKDVNDNTPLHLAIKNGHVDSTKLLVRGGVHCLSNENGMAPIHLAAQSGNVILLLLLLSEWMDTKTNNVDNIVIPSSARTPVKDLVNIPRKFGCETPIDFAVVEKHTDMVKFLLRCGADPNPLKSVQHGNSPTPLLRACVYYSSGDLDKDMAENLLSAGADTERESFFNTHSFSDRPVTPLGYAAKHNSVKLVKFLLRHGADVNNSNQGKCPLFVALSSGSLDVAWYLMKECASVDFKILDDKKRNLLHAVASQGSFTEIEKLVSYLLEKGCDINNSEGASVKGAPIHTAVTRQNKALLQALIKHGASVNIVSSGLAPLHVCADNADVDMAKLLLQSGADIDLVSETTGRSALAMAMECDTDEHYVFSKLLLDLGCYVPFDLSCIIDEEEEDTSDDSDDSDDRRLWRESLNTNVQSLVNTLSSNPRTLIQLCMQSIRRHFILNHLNFSSIEELPLPPVVLSTLMYKTC